ncbi:MAG TPA: alpha/beta hydrolase [Candidatus Saccharimonadia bacterium]|nr:alpha/beta hydrolase [Candidatus Saccharimonadia bacterium]
MQIIVDDMSVNYQIKGEGRVIVLIHGWGVSSENLNVLSTNLARDYQVVSLDLPGFGLSTMPSGVWGLNDYAKFLKAFISKLELSVYSFVGHSNGGSILIYAVASSYLTCKKLVLLGSAGIRNTQKFRRRALYVTAKVGKLPLMLMPSRASKSLKTNFHKIIGSDVDVTPEMIESYKKIVRHDLSGEASKIQTPTLLIYGSNDKDTPPAFGEKYHNLLKTSELKIVNNAGHFVFIDQPAITLELIRTFLK